MNTFKCKKCRKEIPENLVPPQYRIQNEFGTIDPQFCSACKNEKSKDINFL